MENNVKSNYSEENKSDYNNNSNILDQKQLFEQNENKIK